GLLTPWKGQQVLLDAVPLLEESARIEILGGTLPKDTAYAEGLAAQVDALGIGDRVDILGHHPDPLARMRTWTIAVSASTDPEACPLAVLEAMSIGLPVVATDHGGAPEVLDGAGLLVPPRDAAALADAVNCMVRDTSLRTASAQQGLERVSSAHRLDVQTALLLDVLTLSTREGPTT
ncbi:glycosyltransferase family 4 protein, partial [Nocardioides sp.]|uniref:glycosyltransferase family 4 protein n=1 Tax=Nocardioides sp. TaxID=35761 RepID=UPI002B26837E